MLLSPCVVDEVAQAGKGQANVRSLRPGRKRSLSLKRNEEGEEKAHYGGSA